MTKKAKQQLQNNQIHIESQDSIEEKMFTFRENVSEKYCQRTLSLNIATGSGYKAANTG